MKDELKHKLDFGAGPGTILWIVLAAAFVLQLIGPPSGPAAAAGSRENVAYLFALLIPIRWIYQNFYLRKRSIEHRKSLEAEEDPRRKAHMERTLWLRVPSGTFAFYLLATVFFLVFSHKSPALILAGAVWLAVPMVQFGVIMRKWVVGAMAEVSGVHLG